jgi:hypothetical protein
VGTKATLSILAPMQTASNSMDHSSLGLVQNATTVASVTNRVYRLHVEIYMESLPAPKTTPTNEKLCGGAIGNKREQGQDTIQARQGGGGERGTAITAGARKMAIFVRGNQV